MVLKFKDIIRKKQSAFQSENHAKVGSHMHGLSNPVGVVTVDLDAIAENYRLLQKKTGSNCRVSAVVKADAFGLGAVVVTHTLIHAGCNDFFVATPYEGAELRSYFKNCNIYVLNGFFNDCADIYEQNNLIPVLNSLIEIESYQAKASRFGRNLPTFLNFNIRMNRLGLAAAEQTKLLENSSYLNGIDVIGIISHFACADDLDHDLNDTQFENFVTVSKAFPKALKTICNSSGIFQKDDFHCDMVRPGAALYGLNPIPENNNVMQNVVSLKVPVLRTRLVYEGASVGYNATYTFEKDTWIATVSCGYADGLLRGLSNRGSLYWNGYECPIRGRISMDLTTIDLSSVPNNQRPKPGDFIEILGVHQSPDQLAKNADTIGYEILTSLGARYKYQYRYNNKILEADQFQS